MIIENKEEKAHKHEIRKEGRMIRVWKNDGNGVVQCKACGWKGKSQKNNSGCNHQHLIISSNSNHKA